MKSLSRHLIIIGISLGSLSLNGQTAINPNVESFTNADLQQNVGNTNQINPTTPQASNVVTDQQTAPFKYPALTDDQRQQFVGQMNALVQNAEQRVRDLTNRVQDRTIMPMSIDKVELESAIMDLDVKKTLVAKFANSPSLKSPKVQQILLQVLNKNFIQESDLATLQAIVNEERPFTYP